MCTGRKCAFGHKVTPKDVRMSLHYMEFIVLFLQGSVFKVKIVFEV